MGTTDSKVDSNDDTLRAWKLSTGRTPLHALGDRFSGYHCRISREHILTRHTPTRISTLSPNTGKLS